MATEAQIAANRLNAQKSTGPRTAEGKAAVSQNAVKHGLLAREGVLRGEDGEEFQIHREMLLEELRPSGALEAILAARIIDLTWRLQRAAQDQNETFGALYDRHTAGVPQPVEPAERGAILGRMLLEDFEREAVLERLLGQERRIEGSLYRTLNELRRVHDQGRKADREAANTLARWREEDDEARKARAFACWRPADSTPRPDGDETSTPGFEVPHECDVPSWQDICPPADAPMEKETCETNPICPEPNASQVLCGTAVTDDSPPDGLRETNPIWESPGLAGTKASSTDILPVNTEETYLPANPALARAANASGAHGQDGRATHGRDAHATEQPDAGITKVADQGQLCETNPICCGPEASQLQCGTAFMNDPALAGLRETNPIWGSAGREGTKTSGTGILPVNPDHGRDGRATHGQDARQRPGAIALSTETDGLPIGAGSSKLIPTKTDCETAVCPA